MTHRLPGRGSGLLEPQWKVTKPKFSWLSLCSNIWCACHWGVLKGQPSKCPVEVHHGFWFAETKLCRFLKAAHARVLRHPLRMMPGDGPSQRHVCHSRSDTVCSQISSFWSSQRAPPIRLPAPSHCSKGTWQEHDPAAKLDVLQIPGKSVAVPLCSLNARSHTHSIYTVFHHASPTVEIQWNHEWSSTFIQKWSVYVRCMDEILSGWRSFQSCRWSMWPRPLHQARPLNPNLMIMVLMKKGHDKNGFWSYCLKRPTGRSKTTCLLHLCWSICLFWSAAIVQLWSTMCWRSCETSCSMSI